MHFQSITDGVDTKTPAGRFFFNVMASLAQMERELILERTGPDWTPPGAKDASEVESAR